MYRLLLKLYDMAEDGTDSDAGDEGGVEAGDSPEAGDTYVPPAQQSDLLSDVVQKIEDRISKQEDKLQKVLEQNTEAINELKIQIATLSQSLKSINMSWFYEQEDIIH